MKRLIPVLLALLVIPLSYAMGRGIQPNVDAPDPEVSLMDSAGTNAEARPMAVAQGAVTTTVMVGTEQDTFVSPGIQPQGDKDVVWAGLRNNTTVLGFVQFDMDDLDFGAEARVVAVEMRLWCTEWEFLGDPSNKITELRFSVAGTSWDEMRLEDDGRVPRRSSPRFDYNLGDCAPGGEWKSIKDDILIGIVQDWYEGDTGNNGLILGPTRDESLQNHIFKFRSKESEPPVPLGRQPRLLITFENAATPTFEPSATPTPTNTFTPTFTPTPTNTFTPTSTPTITPTPTMTFTPSPTPTPRGIFMPLNMNNFELPTMGPDDPEPEATPTEMGGEPEPTISSVPPPAETVPPPAPTEVP